MGQRKTGPVEAHDGFPSNEHSRTSTDARLLPGGQSLQEEMRYGRNAGYRTGFHQGTE